ncbi:T9SS type A sorting domain-containing protein [Flavobacterium sp. 25HG05S-40]|uniref:T9SS type A sorting domain-containing protein n=1 Tax=Flavobacterium sp. 25HG05S-40 TaxID=3458682 RepID=UPI004043CEBE
MNLKSTFVYIAILTLGCLQAQTGFHTTAVNWSLPQGGQISSTTTYGFNALGDGSTSNLTGDQIWTTMDMNGDSRPDIVVTANVVQQGNYALDMVFGLPSTPYWKVYLNNGNGYNANPINWTLPQGGELSDTGSYGYNAIARGSTSNLTGDQTWTTTDMNGDSRPDIVVTANVVQQGNFARDMVFGLPSNPYWKVYLNNGSGFSTTAVNWTLPQGGELSDTGSYGYNAIARGSTSNLTGDQTWTTTDMNGDSRPDIVVTANVVQQGNYARDMVFGLPTTPYWKVYLNNGSGFSTTAVNWTLPQGGELSDTGSYGYNAIARASTSNLAGDQIWSTTDMNGDSRPDIVVTANVVIQGNFARDMVFGLPSTPYWKVYLNNGSGFSTTAVNWTLPQGGELSSTGSYGYNALARASTSNLAGDQIWSTTDMNGDGKPDIVITANVVIQGNFARDMVFGLPTTPYWKVYLNNGSGHNTTPINWTLPQGGELSSTGSYGYNAVAQGSVSNLVGDQTWSIIDINGDDKLDLAVLSQAVTVSNFSINPVFGLPSTPYWKVYLSNASPLGMTPFNTTAKVTVYPNPSQGLFMIKTEAENVQVIVSDLSGRTIARHNGKTIDLSGCTKGVYLMQVEIDHQTTTQKIILE